MNSGNINFLEPSGPVQACNGTALLLSSVCVCTFVFPICTRRWCSSILFEEYKLSRMAFFGFLNTFFLPSSLSVRTLDSCTFSAVCSQANSTCVQCLEWEVNFPHETRENIVIVRIRRVQICFWQTSTACILDFFADRTCKIHNKWYTLASKLLWNVLATRNFT